MFMGRLGPLSFGVALLARAPRPIAGEGTPAEGALQADTPPPVEDLAV